MELVAQYYKEKYDTTILVGKALNSIEAVDFFEQIKENKQNSADFRCTFILTGMHSTPISYIKEGADEAILISDSLGSDNLEKTIVSVKERFPDIPILVVPDKRQADIACCHIDALVFAKDITAKQRDGHYKFSGLFKQLRPIETDQIKNILLPDFLLKTAQVSKFVETHKDQSIARSVVHTRKNNTQENIDQFRNRYSAVTIGGKKYNSYLQKKGFKFKKIIITQYYKNEILKVLINLGMAKELAQEKANNFALHVKNSGMDITNEAVFICAQEFMAQVSMKMSTTAITTTFAHHHTSVTFFKIPNNAASTKQSPEAGTTGEKGVYSGPNRTPIPVTTER